MSLTISWLANVPRLLRILFQVTLSVIPFWVGTFILGGRVNLLWGTLYGLEWFVSGFFIPLQDYPLIGFLVWPFALTALLYWLAGKVWETGNSRLRWGVIAGLALTLGLSVDAGYFNDSGLWRYFPVWWNFAAVIY